ncbi:ATP-binding protein [Brachyspira hyodysenteriae]|uniref:ATP-binding protein n=1 Tax=Brachyspira hyodysenteriae TaxID=159 RepID=UPI00063DC85A|nr:ATP-binding protein [Brachyspira hyodysenteriae]AUJ49741.1 ATP-binding protein [Brachyspira hyodysenteriae]KLI16284.1 response regulator [Brachyspira hyodysenteriae]KLI18042.1 response regulator [Brachyspira hyodysenteriae]KLI18132.1 response regulator [Brachyspira hyodysenteriae]KLI24062.1 response regulator [Brachyspira hyodysenteriae]
MKKYLLENKLEDITPLIENLSTEVKKYIPSNEMDLFAAALYEVIMNAIEHGNLNILYETKKNWLKKNIYHKKLKELLKTEKAKSTNVEITLQIEEDNITISVKDQGLGFKPKQEAKKINNDGFARESGRGIMMIKSYFDEVKFNKKGNVITLTKLIKKE